MRPPGNSLQSYVDFLFANPPQRMTEERRKTENQIHFKAMYFLSTRTLARTLELEQYKVKTVSTVHIDDIRPRTILIYN